MIMIMNLYSAFSIFIYSNALYKHMDKDQTTTPGTMCPTLYDECVGSLTSPASHYSEDAGDRAYGLSSLSEKTRISNHLQMSLQRHIFSSVSYFKTLSVGPVRSGARTQDLPHGNPTLYQLS